MTVDIREKIAKLNSAQRKKVAARAAELIAEEMSLRQLRKARKLTQARVAKVLGVTQDSVSRLEKRSDLLLSTLRKTVKAMGGEVRIVAEFPDRRPVVSVRLVEFRSGEAIVSPAPQSGKVEGTWGPPLQPRSGAPGGKRPHPFANSAKGWATQNPFRNLRPRHPPKGEHPAHRACCWSGFAASVGHNGNVPSVPLCQGWAACLRARMLSRMDVKVKDSRPFDRAFTRSLLNRAGLFRQSSIVDSSNSRAISCLQL